MKTWCAARPPGVYAVAVDDQTRLRDANGVLLEQRPGLTATQSWAGTVLAVDAPGQYGMLSIPSASSSSIVFGNDLFSSIQVRLSRRDEVQPSVGPGYAFYPSVAPGVSQLMVVGPDQIKENLVVEGPAAGDSFRYELTLPETLSARQVDDTIEIRDADSRVVFSITAPAAYDNHGAAVALSLTYLPDQSAFTVAFVDPPAADAYPVLVDPTFSRVSAINDYAGDEMSIGRIDVDFCGDMGGVTNDRYPAETGSGSFQTCATTNAWNELSPSNTGATDKFSFTSGQADGLSLKARGAVSKGDAASVTIPAPADMGIYASVFRGHTGTALTKHSCELRYAQPPLGDAFMDPYDAAGPRNNRFWGGRPDGAGTSTWATFPVHWGTAQLPDYHVENPTTSPADTHMRGFLGMRRDEDLGTLNGAFRFDVRYQPHAVSMVIRATDDSASGAGIACSSDGHWTVTFFDDQEPTAAAKPSELDASDPSRVWFRKERIAEINSQSAPVRSVTAKLQDKGSGVRRGRLVNDGFARGWVETCATSDIAPGATTNNDSADDPYAVTGAGAKTPCPLTTGTDSYGASDPILANARGYHELAWQAQDFSGRFSPADPGDTKTRRYAVDWDKPSCSATWLPEQPAVNGFVRNGAGAIRVQYSDPYVASQQGSGVQAISVNGGAYIAANPAAAGLDIPYAVSNDTGDYTISVKVRDIAGYESDDCPLIVRVDHTPPADIAPDFVRGASGARVRLHPVLDAHSGTSRYEWTATDDNGAALCPTVNHVISQPAIAPGAALSSYWVESELCAAAVNEHIRFSVRAIDALDNTVIGSADGRVDAQPDVQRSAIDPAEVRYQNAADRLFERYASLGNENTDPPSVEFIAVNLSDPDGSPDLTAVNPIDVAAPARGAARDFAEATLYVYDDNTTSPEAGATIRWRFGTSENDASDIVSMSNQDGTGGVTCGAGGFIQTRYWVLDCVSSGFDDGSGKLVLALQPRVDSGVRATPDQRYKVRATLRDRRQEADYKFLRDTATLATQAVDAPSDPTGGTDIGDTVVDRIAPAVDLSGPNEGATSYIGSTFVTAGIQGSNVSPTLAATAMDIQPFSTLLPPSATNPATLYASGVRFVDYTLNRTTAAGTTDVTASCTPNSWDRLSPAWRTSSTREDTDNLDVLTHDSTDDPRTPGIDEPNYRCTYASVPEGDFAVEVCARDRVGNRSCASSRLIVDRTNPCAAEAIAVRGATGQRLRWKPVTCDVNGNAVQGTRDLSGVERYEWRASMTANGPAVCSGTVTQPTTPPATGWIETDLCRNNGADFTPGTRLFWTLVTFDRAQNSSTSTVSETVDIRPVIARPSFESNDIRYDSFNGTVYPNGATSRDLIADVSDRDGASDIDTVNVKDPAAPARTQMDDWAIATVFVTDSLGDNPASDRDDVDASIAVEWAFGTVARPGTAIITLREAGNATTQSCAAGSTDVLRMAYWTFDCQRATSTPISNGHRLTLPLHPRDNQTTDTGRYPTPDQRYAVTGFVRDRKQPADYMHLSNAADGATDVAAAPPANTSASLADDNDMGLLVLDRIVPDGVLTFPNTDPITSTSDRDVTLRARGQDVIPGTTLAPLSLRDIITSPQTLNETGMDHLTWDVYQHDEDLGQLGPVVAAPNAGCKTQAATDGEERSCLWSNAPYGNYDVTSTFTDIAGNHWTTPKRWLRVEPDACSNIPGIQPTVPAGYVLTANGTCVQDECPNLAGLQTSVPDGYYKDVAGFCQPDQCPDLAGIQVEVPDGYIKDAAGNCLRDLCPNIDGAQDRVPSGMGLDADGNCVPDVCPNIAGNQASVPNGMVVDANGDCITPPDPDLCSNIAGIQRQVPNGLTRLLDGRCVADLCSNIEGVQETVPDGFVRLHGECFRLPPPPPPTDNYQGQYPHVEPLGVMNTATETRNEPEDGFPDDPANFQIDFGKANLHLQCGRDNVSKKIVCPDWNGEFDFTYIGSPAFSWRVRDLSQGDQVDSARGETQFSWSRDHVQNGVTVRDVWTITKVQAELSVGGIVYPDATIQVVSHTTGGLQNKAQDGYVSLWVWKTADTAQPWDFHAEGAMQVDCQATNNCPDAPVIPNP
jgi:hypothetical protein